MPAVSKSFSERDPLKMGLVGVVVIAAVVGLSLNAAKVMRSITETSYHAIFSDAGGLSTGDEVEISGLSVGTVKGIEIVNDEVQVDFSLNNDIHLGNGTLAAIQSQTVLGRKFLAVTPAGIGQMSSGGTIPLARTTTPYDVQEQLQTLSKTVQPLNKAKLAESLSTVSSAMQNTPPEVHAALASLQRGLNVITSRNQALLELLNSASGVSGILARRSGQIVTLIGDGNHLLAALYERRDALQALLTNVESLVGQVHGLVLDNRGKIANSLAELHQVSTLLIQNKDNVTAAIEGFRDYAGSLGEAVNAGPWFFGYVANLAPAANLGQQSYQSILKELLQSGALK